MRILIIGSEGFIGRHCILFFQSHNHQVYGCDLQDLKAPNYSYFKISRLAPGFDDIFRVNQFDICINAAGSGSVPVSIANPYGDFEANTIDTFKILESVRLYNPSCKYVNISSAAVYGNPKQLPISETDELQPLSPYGWHKFYSELICREYSSLYNIRTCSLRPFSVYGPGLKKQIFWDIYQKIALSNDLTLFGTGLESRDFIYITDLIDCIALVVDKEVMNGEAYNAASGIEHTIEEVTTNFVRYLKPGVKVNFNGEHRQGDPNNWRADIGKLTKIGFNPQTSLEQGLKNYAQWLEEKS